MPGFKIGKSYLIVDDWSNVKYVQACATKWELENNQIGQWLLQAKINQITRDHLDELEEYMLAGYEHFKLKHGLEVYRALYVKYGHFSWGAECQE